MEAVPGVLLFTLGFYVVIFIVFQIFYARHGYYKLPNERKDGSLGSVDDKDAVVYKNVFKLIYHSFRIIYKSKTWVLANHLGTEQTLYLYYQTESLKMMCFLAVMMLVILSVSTLFVGAPLVDGFYRFLALISSYRLNSWNFTCFLQVIVSTIITVFCIRMRRLTIQQNYIKFQRSEKTKDIKRATWHQLRTLEIKGGLESDFPGKAIKKVLKAIMKKNKINGKLVAVKAVPSLEKVVEIERNREAMLAKFTMKASRKCGCLSTMCIKKHFYDPKAMNKQLIDWNRQVKKHLRHIKCSSHVFAFLDTPETAYALKTAIEKNPIVHIDELMKDKKQNKMRRGDSFFIKNGLGTNHATRFYDYDQAELSVTYMPHVIDILWRNMAPKQFKHSIKKCVIYTILIFMLIFVSTPAAMLQNLKSTSGVATYLLTFRFLFNLPEPMKIFLVDYLTTLSISGLNALASELIDHLSSGKNYTRISKYHSFVFTNMIFYFTVNMILMPGISLSSDNTIFDAFKKNTNFDVKDFADSFYLKDSGQFFFILILQKASLSFANTFLRLPDLSKYFTLSASTKARQALRTKGYYKHEFDTFPYGYYYGMNVSVINICAIFAVHIPALTLACILYFIFRLVNDGISMFSVYGRDLEGNGILSYYACQYSHIGVLMSHLFLTISSIIRAEYFAAWVNLFCFLGSIFIHFKLIKNPIEFGKIIKMSSDIKSEKPSKHDLQQWISCYTHPIMKMNKYFYAYKKNFESPLKHNSFDDPAFEFKEFHEETSQEDNRMVSRPRHGSKESSAEKPRKKLRRKRKRLGGLEDEEGNESDGESAEIKFQFQNSESEEPINKKSSPRIEQKKRYREKVGEVLDPDNGFNLELKVNKTEDNIKDEEKEVLNIENENAGLDCQNGNNWCSESDDSNHVSINPGELLVLNNEVLETEEDRVIKEDKCSILKKKKYPTLFNKDF